MKVVSIRKKNSDMEILKIEYNFLILINCLDNFTTLITI